MGIPDELNSKFSVLLKDSILISTNISNEREIVFDFVAKESDEWSRHYLYIRGIDNFYFQRYESSFQRRGLVNLRRIKINENHAEWISEIKDWSNLFTKESGIEFKLYNGSIFRFVGSDLSLEESFVEGSIDSVARYINEKPDQIEQSKAKVIVNEKSSKPVLNKVGRIIISAEEIAENEVITAEETASSNQLDQATENIKLEFEEALDQIENLTDKPSIENVDLTSESVNISDQDLTKVFIPENIDKKIVTKGEKLSLVNQINEYAHPKPTDTMLVDSKIHSLDQESNLSIEKQSIKLVDGVTESNLKRIEELGFDTISKLSVAKIAELIKINGVGKATARKIIQSAKSMIQDQES